MSTTKTQERLGVRTKTRRGRQTGFDHGVFEISTPSGTNFARTGFTAEDGRAVQKDNIHVHGVKAATIDMYDMKAGRDRYKVLTVMVNDTDRNNGCSDISFELTLFIDADGEVTFTGDAAQ